MKRPYLNYRPSGVEWMGEIPEHWGVRRLKDVGRLIAGSAFPEALQGIEGEDLPFYKVADLNNSDDGRWMSNPNHTISRTTAEMLKARVVPAKAVVYAKIGAALLLNRRRLTIGSCCIDNNMSAYVPDNARITTEWALYACCLLDFKRHVNPGAVPSLSEGDQSVLPILVPSVQEQRAIATFLDAGTAKIDTLVAKNRLLLERLAEYRTALIAHTVTKGLPPEAAREAGLNPNPPLKPSGVAWLGAIPEHWELSQLGRLGSFFKGGGGTKEDEVEGGLPCIRYGDLYTQHEFLIRSSRAGIAEESTDRYRRLRYGDILFAGSGETIEEIGKSAVNLIEDPAYCGGDVIGFRPSIDTDATFFGYATDCATASYQKACMGRGVTVMHIYSSELKYLLIPLPPPREQQSIAEFLNTKLMDADTLSSRVEGAVERLQEYRTALITAAVTGKIDVRELEQVQIGASRT